MRKRKTTCSRCGKPLEEKRLNKYRYCLACHAEHMNRTRPKFCDLPEEQQKKVRARTRTRMLIVRGKMTKGPCIICGETKVEAHHPDYSKPREVIWYCRAHHLELHKK